MVLIIVMAYCIGSVPFALLLARGDDVRRIGSGNVGAANVLRASGVRVGVLVAMLDIAKGAASVVLAMRLSTDGGVPAAAGFAAIVGHIYPVWLRFQRRKRRRHRVRRLHRADSAGGASGIRGVHRDGLGHALRVPRIGARDDRPAAGRVRDGVFDGDADGSVRGLAYSFSSGIAATWRGCVPAPNGDWEREPDGGRCGTRGGKLGDGAGGAPGPGRPRRPAVGARSGASSTTWRRAAPTWSTCPT